MSLSELTVWDIQLKEEDTLNADNRCVVKEEQREEQRSEEQSWNTFLKLGA